MRWRPKGEIPGWTADARVGVLVATLSLAGLTAVLAPLLGEDEIVAVAMLFLLVVLLVSATWGYVVGLIGAVLADVLLNVFFVPPLHTFTVQQPRNVVALVIFLAVAVVGASMLALLRRQLAVSRERRAELTAMLGLSRELASAPTPGRALDALADAIARAVHAEHCEILQFSGGAWSVAASTGRGRELTRDDIALAQAAADSGELTRRIRGGPDSARRAVRRHPPGETFVPFRPPGGEPGVIHITGVLTAPPGSDLDALLAAFADEAGVAVHRARLADEARNTEALRQSDEFKTALLSSVSHDLRSPLTAIKAAVGSLRSREITWTDADREQLLGAIESQTDRLSATVADLLDMSRLEGGAVRPSLEPIQVQALYQDVLLAALSATTGREVCVEAPEDLWVRADYGLLLRALANLVENAAKYSTPGGAIHLKARALPGRVRLDVIDEGPGISEADLPHIFERFYRGAEGKRVHGTGLGLAIVRAMIELCGGRVNVESTASGSTFSISLPPARPSK
ncbi:MAG: ATP-binding protein [Dehalococcoidia bacterium]